MAVFHYEAITEIEGEELTETGTVDALDEEEAKAKLNKSGFSEVHLERIQWYAFWKRFSSDIK